MFRFLSYFMRALAPATAMAKGAGMEALETMEDLAACLARSEAEPVLIFKHSTRCPISTAAMSEMKSYVTRGGEVAPVYLNLVVESRAVSNEIASQLATRHESPQLLLVQGRTAVWHASHGGIRADSVVAAVASCAG